MFDTINITGKTFDELMAMFFCDVRGDDDYYDVIAYNLAQEYRRQVEVMLPVLSCNRLRAAICGLGLSDSPDQSLNIVESYIHHDDPDVASAAVDALRRMESGDWEHVAPLLDHQSPFVRGSALRYCRAKLGVGCASYLLSALKDPDPIVREDALDELDGIVDSTMVGPIRAMMTDSSVAVRQAAETLLEAFKDNDEH